VVSCLRAQANACLPGESLAQLPPSLTAENRHHEARVSARKKRLLLGEYSQIETEDGLVTGRTLARQTATVAECHSFRRVAICRGKERI